MPIILSVICSANETWKLVSGFTTPNVYFFSELQSKKQNCSIKKIENTEIHFHIKEAGTRKCLIFLREKKT